MTRIGFIAWRATEDELRPFFFPLGESGALDAGFLLAARIRSGALSPEQLAPTFESPDWIPGGSWSRHRSARAS